MTAEPIRLPDIASVQAVLKSLEPVSADAELAPALANAFPGFEFTAASIDDFYWRGDARTVLSPSGTRIGDHRAWVERELADLSGDLTAFWNRHRSGDLRFTEWRGASVFAFAPTGLGVADFVQLSLGREIEVLAGPVVDPDYRPHNADDLLDPSWVRREPDAVAPVLAGPIYRLRGRAGGGIVHMRSFLARQARIEREQRAARRPGLENRVIHEVGSESKRDTPFLDANPDWFDFVPRENRFFADWQRSSACDHRIFDHWAFDIHDLEHRDRREIGFIPRPLRFPSEQLLAEDSVSVHRLMERIEAIDAEVGLPFAWFFLMTHGHWVDPDVGDAIADGLRQGRVRLPDRDAAVLLAWADEPYLF
ncbi:hypothetical protein [Mesorhizobium sp. M1E.F.Ca.ET.041.01.1.1]|uniref:hypothetical protein n=1 Tax=Mesorhizobium sp. M1E.F.Ca.ET.041.01.1.1 TaxID=2496759 RepID=UPI000FCABD2A|nr:hypothetical protein [Mesorhizobium sp. M1E.F.Ca.ET.041.01.1.1]RUW21028.1 hypothetical protein EOA38_32600 [Mesorhizobium sp. M1E.F.Ca.ET.041.01.1.1]